MSLNKAIISGKEHRKQYRGSKVICASCRNHGGCPLCEENRMINDIKNREKFKIDLKEFENNDCN